MNNYGIIIDLETGGLDPEKCAVTEIGAVAFRSTGFSIYETARLHCIVKPTPGLLVEEKAAQVQGYTVEAIRTRAGHHEADAIHELKIFIADHLPDEPPHKQVSRIYAHNAHFDFRFLCESSRRSAWVLPFGRLENPMNCTLKLYQMQKQAGLWPDMPDVSIGGSLAKLCEAWGIERKEPHDALSDCRATLQVLDRLQKLMRGENVPAPSG